MLLIRSIDVIEVSRDALNIASLERNVFVEDVTGKEYLEVGLVEEYVKGTRFKDALGNNVYIGATKQAELAIGLPFNEIHSLRNFNLCLTSRLLETESELRRIEKLGFIGRLKFLFRGYVSHGKHTPVAPGEHVD